MSRPAAAYHASCPSSPAPAALRATSTSRCDAERCSAHTSLAHGGHRRLRHPGRPRPHRRRPGLGEPREHGQPSVPPLPKMPGQRRSALHHQRIDRVHHRPPAAP
ncbi:hypothetical protein ACFRC1_37540 [Streptomyces sp. NPDC056626]|uniref:hypothetical protein n=1 Tax=Streptomyces sp. NPDC056626 TaxID=3345880 RepID=UPI000A6BD8A7